MYNKNNIPNIFYFEMIRFSGIYYTIRNKNIYTIQYKDKYTRKPKYSEVSIEYMLDCLNKGLFIIV